MKTLKLIFFIAILCVFAIGNSQTPAPKGTYYPNATKSDTLSLKTRIPIFDSRNVLNKYVPIDSLSAHISINQDNIFRGYVLGTLPNNYGSTITSIVNTVGITISETEIVLLRFFAYEGSILYYYVYGLSGKGTYNLTTPATNSNLNFISKHPVTSAIQNAVGTTIDLGDIGYSTIEDYINALPSTSYPLLENIIYFFTTIENGVNNSYLWIGTTPLTIGSGSTIVTNADFSLISQDGVDVYNTPHPTLISAFTNDVPYLVSADLFMESLNEGNGVGWRIRGRNPLNYGNIGQNAMDFSESSTASSTFGATGYGSTVFGFENTGPGAYSFTQGYQNITGGYSDAVFGTYNQTGTPSSTRGYRFVAGIRNDVDAQFGGVALGNGLWNDAYGATVVGQSSTQITGGFNVGTTPMFVVGNGDFNYNVGVLDVITRSDAFRVLKSGKLEVPSYGSGTFTGTPAYALQVDASGNVIEGALGGGGLSNIVEDTTPQLGGTLDTQGNNITTPSWLRIGVGNLQEFSVWDTNIGGVNIFSTRLYEPASSGSVVKVGQQDDSRGYIIASGDLTTYGGYIRLDNASDEDTTTNYWGIEADQNFKIFNLTTSALEIDDLTSGIIAPATSVADIDALGNTALTTKEWVTAQGYSTGGGTWGSITGTLSSQTDLQNALALKADTSSLVNYVDLSTNQNIAGVKTFTASGALTPINIGGSSTDAVYPDLYIGHFNPNINSSALFLNGTAGSNGYLISVNNNLVKTFSVTKTGYIQASNIALTGKTSDDVLLGNGTTTSLAGIIGGGASASVSDTSYGVSWNGSTTTAPSQNAVYDKIETVIAGVGTGATPEIFTAVGGETNWVLTNPIVPSHKFFVNGVKMVEGTDYTQTGSTITFTGYTPVAGNKWEYYPDIAVPTTYTASQTSITDVGGIITSTDVEGALQENRTSINLNTAKVTNATHTGDVTGATNLTIDPTAISGKTLKSTLIGTEEVLVNDAGTIKKTTAQDIADLGGGGASVYQSAIVSIVDPIVSTTTTVIVPDQGVNKVVSIKGTEFVVNNISAATGTITMRVRYNGDGNTLSSISLLLAGTTTIKHGSINADGYELRTSSGFGGGIGNGSTQGDVIVDFTGTTDSLTGTIYVKVYYTVYDAITGF
tara:strand:- start:5701 stop:9123 length:3423 start_codon:yes stop_codon:yes gene_type:complete